MLAGRTIAFHSAEMPWAIATMTSANGVSAGARLLAEDGFDLRRQAWALPVRPRDVELVAADHVRHLGGEGDIRVGVGGG